ncbi:carboxymuconolactone decarboxylase family protein [Ectothiorhodospira variabilis]|uniref:carboxymuconolactone decarboxylase family protein n=1 Tax=Ectothiorhodospira variabilis TaxID=505694 RepID=UPI001EFADA8D|nr:carboxymuconolactone decarboxylase family protein [Ectothiorhodospira variabilis]MCG5497678.1 carboxymuconolactone decarboxylase family protein [Ectothiorhodospira variabilis]
MPKDWNQTAKQLGGLMQEMGSGIPEVAKAFGAMDKAACHEGAVSAKHKELMALAIGIALRCEGCIAFHTKAAIKHGATREEVMETIGLSIYMGGGPSYVYGAQALEAFDQMSG